MLRLIVLWGALLAGGMCWADGVVTVVNAKGLNYHLDEWIAKMTAIEDPPGYSSYASYKAERPFDALMALLTFCRSQNLCAHANPEIKIEVDVAHAVLNAVAERTTPYMYSPETPIEKVRKDWEDIPFLDDEHFLGLPQRIQIWAQSAVNALAANIFERTQVNQVLAKIRQQGVSNSRLLRIATLSQDPERCQFQDQATRRKVHQALVLLFVRGVYLNWGDFRTQYGSRLSAPLKLLPEQYQKPLVKFLSQDSRHQEYEQLRQWFFQNPSQQIRLFYDYYRSVAVKPHSHSHRAFAAISPLAQEAVLAHSIMALRSLGFTNLKEAKQALENNKLSLEDLNRAHLDREDGLLLESRILANQADDAWVNYDWHRHSGVAPERSCIFAQ